MFYLFLCKGHASDTPKPENLLPVINPKASQILQLSIVLYTL